MTYNVTFNNIYSCKANSEEEAKKLFIRYIEDEDFDGYGRSWKQLLTIEELKE